MTIRIASVANEYSSFKTAAWHHGGKSCALFLSRDVSQLFPRKQTTCCAMCTVNGRNEWIWLAYPVTWCYVMVFRGEQVDMRRERKNDIFWLTKWHGDLSIRMIATQVDNTEAFDYPSRPKRTRHDSGKHFSADGVSEKTLDIVDVIGILKKYSEYEGGVNCCMCGKVNFSLLCKWSK